MVIEMDIFISGKEVELDLNIKEKVPYLIPRTGTWNKKQCIEVKDNDETIARIDFDIILLNEKRGAKDALLLFEGIKEVDPMGELEYIPWEVPLSYMNGCQVIPKIKEHWYEEYRPLKKAKHVFIKGITVLPHYRRNGIGEMLIKEVALLNKDAESIWLKVQPVTQSEKDAFNKYQKKLFSTENPDMDDLISFFRPYGFKRLEDENIEGIYMLSTINAVINCLVNNTIYSY